MLWASIKASMAGVLDPTVWDVHFRDLRLRDCDGKTAVVSLPQRALVATERVRCHIDRAVMGQHGVKLVFVAAPG